MTTRNRKIDFNLPDPDNPDYLPAVAFLAYGPGQREHARLVLSPNVYYQIRRGGHMAEVDMREICHLTHCSVIHGTRDITQSPLSYYVEDLRRRMGVTLEEMGARIGVTRQTVSNWLQRNEMSFRDACACLHALTPEMRVTIEQVTPETQKVYTSDMWARTQGIPVPQAPQDRVMLGELDPLEAEGVAVLLRLGELGTKYRGQLNGPCRHGYMKGLPALELLECHEFGIWHKHNKPSSTTIWKLRSQAAMQHGLQPGTPMTPWGRRAYAWQKLENPAYRHPYFQYEYVPDRFRALAEQAYRAGETSATITQRYGLGEPDTESEFPLDDAVHAVPDSPTEYDPEPEDIMAVESTLNAQAESHDKRQYATSHLTTTFLHWNKRMRIDAKRYAPEAELRLGDGLVYDSAHALPCLSVVSNGFGGPELRLGGMPVDVSVGAVNQFLIEFMAEAPYIVRSVFTAADLDISQGEFDHMTRDGEIDVSDLPFHKLVWLWISLGLTPQLRVTIAAPQGHAGHDVVVHIPVLAEKIATEVRP